MYSMQKIISILLIFALSVSPVSGLGSFHHSEPDQTDEKVIVIHQRVGKSIDAQEKEYYKLFQVYENFQSAVVMQKGYSQFILQITGKREGNNQIFASRYKLYLPSEEELASEIRKERLLIEQETLLKSTGENDG